MTVEVENVVRRFGNSAALEGVSLVLRPGEFAALLGPSGSGKTTLLRILAGLDFPDAGRVRMAGQDVAGVPARQRGVGVVFQHYALFRHMTVAENVAFGLRVRPRRLRPAQAEITRRVTTLLELMQIPELAHRYPDQVSGGQRQRVALARALAIEPQLLLLDEPFGALDARVRRDVRRWVRGLHDRLGITSILVTHDQEEAMELADRVAVMDRGRILQFATPRTLLDTPATAFVAGFIGEAGRLEGEIQDGWLHFPGLPLSPLRLSGADGAATAFARRGDVLVEVLDGPEQGFEVLLVREEQDATHVVLQYGTTTLEGTLARNVPPPNRGDVCRVRISRLQVFTIDGGRISTFPQGLDAIGV